tara:strand:- start:442 stop:1176 length:735 start_codon:yes stop_codon:yes gene_type:complete
MKTAVILAAGLGSRIKGIINEIPKGFIKIGQETLIHRSLRILKSFGISNIIIATGYKSEFYDELSSRYNIVCVKNEKYFCTGSFYSLKNSSKYINDDFLLLESDLIYEQDAIKHLLDSEFSNVLLGSAISNSGDEVFIEHDKDSHLINLSKNRKKIKRTSCEFVGISKISLDYFSVLCNWHNNNKVIAKKLHYEEAIAMANIAKNVYVNEVRDLIWSEIDNEQHLNRTRDHIYPLLVKKDQGAN